MARHCVLDSGVALPIEVVVGASLGERGSRRKTLVAVVEVVGFDLNFDPVALRCFPTGRDVVEVHQLVDHRQSAGLLVYRSG